MIWCGHPGTTTRAARYFQSRTGKNAPQLVIEYGMPTPTHTPTATATATPTPVGHGRVAYIINRDEAAAVDLHHVALLQQPQLGVDPADQSRNGRLAGTRVAGEHHVQRHWLHGQVPQTPTVVHRDEVDELAQLGLDLPEADQLIEFPHHRTR